MFFKEKRNLEDIKEELGNMAWEKNTSKDDISLVLCIVG